MIKIYFKDGLDVVIGKLKLKLALWLLKNMPENIWIGKNRNILTSQIHWQSGIVDKNGILQKRNLDKIFDNYEIEQARVSGLAYRMNLLKTLKNKSKIDEDYVTLATHKELHNIENSNN